MRRLRLFVICGAILFLCGVPSPAAYAQDGEEARAQLHARFDEAWQFQVKENPLLATRAGEYESNHLLPSVSTEDQARRAAFWSGLLDRLHAIDRSRLSREDQINYDLFEREVEDHIAGVRFKRYLIPISAESGFHIAFGNLPNWVPLETTDHYEDYLARLRAFPVYMDQHIALMREGVEIGYTLPKAVLTGYAVAVEPFIVDEPAQSGFWEPFDTFPPTVPPEDHERLRAAGRSAIAENVIPAYRRFLEFMRTEYVPNARETVATSALPDGRTYYEYLVRYYTTLDLTPEQVHEIGLEEVQRIRAEMMDVMEQVGFEGSFLEFLEFLRTDPRFYADTPEELLKEAAYIAKRMDGKLPSMFKTLPRLPYGIEPVPDHIAPNYTGGRYVLGAPGSRRGGTYWVNTYKLDSRPLYVLESLTFHEAVPGHHLQIALHQELEGLPDFRRHAGVDAFSEGWALYAEWLGLEAGFYTDPYSNFGRLTYEMWRACRLVVDTGMHALGWTRQQALDFLASNTALSLHEVTTETDRYISTPGQALAYKMGELKIRELRRKAEGALGRNFDLRAFHDAVLRNGAIPLSVLEQEIDRFIEAELASR